MFILADPESVTLYCSACCRTLASMVSAFSSAPCGIDDMTSVFTYSLFVTYAKTNPLRPQASRNCAMCAYVSSKRSLGAMLPARNNTSPY